MHTRELGDMRYFITCFRMISPLIKERKCNLYRVEFGFPNTYEDLTYIYTPKVITIIVYRDRDKLM